MAGEFLLYFFDLIEGGRRAEVDPKLKRQVDPDDLVQSVLGDILPRLGEFEFRTRAEYLSLLTLRVGWKLQDKLRRASVHATGTADWAVAQAHADDRADGRPQPLSETPTPLTAIVREEEEAFLVLALNRLPAGDQRLIRASLEGQSRSEMAEQEGCSEVALRKRLERARAALRSEVRDLAGASRVTSPEALVHA